MSISNGRVSIFPLPHPSSPLPRAFLLRLPSAGGRPRILKKKPRLTQACQLRQIHPPQTLQSAKAAQHRHPKRPCARLRRPPLLPRRDTAVKFRPLDEKTSRKKRNTFAANTYVHVGRGRRTGWKALHFSRAFWFSRERLRVLIITCTA